MHFEANRLRSAASSHRNLLSNRRRPLLLETQLQRFMSNKRSIRYRFLLVPCDLTASHSQANRREQCQSHFATIPIIADQVWITLRSPCHTTIEEVGDNNLLCLTRADRDEQCFDAEFEIRE